MLPCDMAGGSAVRYGYLSTEHPGGAGDIRQNPVAKEGLGSWLIGTLQRGD